MILFGTVPIYSSELANYRVKASLAIISIKFFLFMFVEAILSLRRHPDYPDTPTAEIPQTLRLFRLLRLCSVLRLHVFGQVSSSGERFLTCSTSEIYSHVRRSHVLTKIGRRAISVCALCARNFWRRDRMWRRRKRRHCDALADSDGCTWLYRR